jgi:hypothetical protein
LFDAVAAFFDDAIVNADSEPTGVQICQVSLTDSKSNQSTRACCLIHTVRTMFCGEGVNVTHLPSHAASRLPKRPEAYLEARPLVLFAVAVHSVDSRALPIIQPALWLIQSFGGANFVSNDYHLMSLMVESQTKAQARARTGGFINDFGMERPDANA